MLASNVYFHSLQVNFSDNSYVWHQKVDFLFKELIISWNALRPKKGLFLFDLRFKSDVWSSWLRIAEWGKGNKGEYWQRGFAVDSKEMTFSHDVLTLAEGMGATEFEVCVSSQDGSDLRDVHYFWACAWQKVPDHSMDDLPKPSFAISSFPSVSQMLVPHPEASRMCSPTSTFALVNFLKTRSSSINPNEVVEFAERVYDQRGCIYGNWSLNMAGAYDFLEGKYFCYAARMNSLTDLYFYLEKKIPIVVSIKGPIVKGASSYSEGHLMVVIGWDSQKRQVICMDPAFPSHQTTKVAYALSEFLQAWSRRNYLAYLIHY